MQNQITSPRQFFENIVTPDFNDFQNNQGDIRLALHICMSLDHLIDWIAKSTGQSRGNLLTQKCALCADIRVIRNISVNAKHFPPDNAPVMHVATTAASLTVDEITTNIDAIPSWDSFGAAPQVIARVHNAEKLWLVNPITTAYEFWKREYGQNLW